MTEDQWLKLKEAVAQAKVVHPHMAFIIDSPWLPGFFGIDTLEYYTSGQKWYDANIQAMESFPDITFLPGFWAEFGMCTEPSAFGSKCAWQKVNLPHPETVITDISDIKGLKKPNPRNDGLLPFVIERLKEYEERITRMGHRIPFAISRGPLNIASFLMGTTEFMTAIIMQPEEIHSLLRLITDFVIDWLQYQKEIFPVIDGIFILDDMVGFLGDMECRDFVIPYLSESFNAIDASVRFFHNDASGLVSSPYLREIGVNLFNFSYQHSFKEIMELTGNDMILLGNLPPRDVLAAGTVMDIQAGVKSMMDSAPDRAKIIWSCGGGVPQGVSLENMLSFYDTVVNLS